MASTFLKWLVPGVIVIAGGTAFAIAQTGAPIASDLQSRIATSLASGDFDWTSVRIDGRDAILTGTATNQQMIDDATARVAEIHGVRAVSTDIVLAEFVSPFPFAATIAGETITLSGGYPDETVHAALISNNPDVTDTTRLLSGAPDAASFESAATFGLAALKQLDQGEIRLADLSLTIEGRAKSTEAYGALQALPQQLPPRIQLAALTITPPLASPYVWTATYDGASVGLSGNVPSADLESQFRAAAPANVPVATSLVLASGEPAAFAANALVLLNNLLLLEGGEVSITDGEIVLTGAPATSEIADTVTAAITAIGGTVKLEPPRIADFTLAIDKTAGGLKFSGFVPDAATRDRLAALDGATVEGLQLGRGAPDRFASGLDFGLEALGHLGEGRFELKGNQLSLGGRAATVPDFRAVEAMAREGAPQGLALGAVQLKPPVAAPFIFSAVKSPEGATALSGYLPDDAARTRLTPLIANLASDATDPADGAPENFVFLAGKGLEVLALLDSGTLSFDGSNWSIDGIAGTPQQGFAADAAYSTAGLRTMGWSYTVRLPGAAVAENLPIITPYVWRAQKMADGAVSITGFAPSNDFKRRILGRAEQASDSSVLGAGAPDDFDASAEAGIEALLALDEGSLALNGNRWTLTGEVADAASRAAIQTALGDKVTVANWQIAVQARDSAPVVTPYLWSATKAPDGGVELSGYLPDEGLRSFAAVRAGTVSRDTTALASGEPAGFADDLLAGLEALNNLSSGRALFDGSRWILTGEAATQEQGAAAAAALLKGSRDGVQWTSAISGFTPQAEVPSSSEAAMSSSEAPPSSSEEPAASSEEVVTPAPSSEPPPASEPSAAMSSEPSSIEPVSSEPVPELSSEPAAAPSSEPAPEPTPEPEEDRALTMVDPLPARFVFEAARESGQPIALQGGVPALDVAAAFGALAGDVPIDALLPQAGLPADFVPSASAGLEGAHRAHRGAAGLRWQPLVAAWRQRQGRPTRRGPRRDRGAAQWRRLVGVRRSAAAAGSVPRSGRRTGTPQRHRLPVRQCHAGRNVVARHRRTGNRSRHLSGGLGACRRPYGCRWRRGPQPRSVGGARRDGGRSADRARRRDRAALCRGLWRVPADRRQRNPRWQGAEPPHRLLDLGGIGGARFADLSSRGLLALHGRGRGHRPRRRLVQFRAAEEVTRPCRASSTLPKSPPC